MQVVFNLYGDEEHVWKAEVNNEKEMELLRKCINNALKLYDVLRTD